jgi:hypothetical protein
MLDGYNRYRDATGAILEEDTGLLSIISAQYDNLQSFIRVIRVNKYELTANAQIWPRTLNHG